MFCWPGCEGVGRSLLIYVSTLSKLTKLAKYNRTRGRRTPGLGHPGIVFVCSSSLNVNSLDYCKTAGVSAPGVSGLTTRKMRFAGTCTASTADAPSHCNVLAKYCP